MPEILIGVGSNIGDRTEWIKGSLHRIRDDGKIQLWRNSHLRLYPPLGGMKQREFLNGVFVGYTPLMPLSLLEYLKKVERQFCRRPTYKWGPRTLDLDILFYGKSVLTLPRLCVPHRSFLKREFALELAAEVCPRLKHPVVGRTCQELWREFAEKKHHNSPPASPGWPR
ncbi:MAG: 2-amino-4-hydroxy-6-hydroxymethyldihydropteridine diphosphokinase [Planctomycetota bacterium]|nr:MAG: 2-amino-4-hydroxy-6-hydroxymethyldihydropteridine diphosphokinase [Planctomycetota bacterium]